MNIFVTGGAGYIGSATAEALLKAGHTVTVYDSLVTGHRQAVPEAATFIQADISDSHALAVALTGQKYAAVMHFAAFIEAGESMKDPGKFLRNNLINSLSLIDMESRPACRVLCFPPPPQSITPAKNRWLKPQRLVHRIHTATQNWP